MKTEETFDTDYSPRYKEFEEKLLKDNPKMTEKELSFYEKYKNKICYYRMSLLNKVDIPDKETVAYTYLKRRKIFKHYKCGELYNIRGKKVNLYENLEGTVLGFIPTVNNGCIIVKRRRITLYDVLFPIALVRIAVYFIFKV